MITITLNELKAIEEPLQKLVNEKLPIKIGYKLSKIIPVLNEEFKKFDEFRIASIKRLGAEKEDGSYEVTSENQNQFVSEMNELLLEEIKLDFDPISIEVLSDDTKLSAIELTVLSKFFTD